MSLRRMLLVGLLLVVAGRMALAERYSAEAAAHSAALNSITTEEVKEFISALADDTFEGRASGTRGGRAAGIYIIERLKKYGLHPAGVKGSFYQSFNDTYHNILALCEGSDPKLKQQVIVIGAHYDHVGYGSSRTSFGPLGMIHNGADDNASGVVGLLEVAKAISQLPERPKRSILFAFWDGEELGLLGSQHWAERPTVPLARVPIVINADMIGRLRKAQLTVYGVRTTSGLRKLISRQNSVPRLVLDFTWEMRSDSDHHTFFSRDIPIVMMHTGLHGDYHRPSDDADKINVEGLKNIAQLMFGVVTDLADAPQLAGFRSRARSESTFDQHRVETPLAPLPGRLGVRWDETIANREGKLVLTAVSQGSAAEKGGLRAGDRLIRFADREITGIPQFRLAVLAAQNPVKAVVARSESAEPIELELNLPGQPVRLGVSWRIDETEPGTVIVNRVTPGSPAAMAGLLANDRIYRVGGQEFTDGESFRQLANAGPGPLELEVETAGVIRSVEIPPITEPEKQIAGGSDGTTASDQAR